MNWTDKRREPLSRFSGSHRGEKRGAMKAVERLGSKEDWSTVYESKSLYFGDLKIYLVTCLAQIKIKELNDNPFPPSREDFETMREFLIAPDADQEEQEPISEEEIFEFWKNADKKYFESVDIKELDDISGKLMLATNCLSILYDWTANNYLKADIPLLSKLDVIGAWTIAKSHEFIGYWTAKMEESERNKSGAYTMKEKGLATDEAIREVISKYDVKSFQCFRKNKKLRESFFKEAKKATTDFKFNVPLAEDTIRRKAVKILKAKASP